MKNYITVLFRTEEKNVQKRMKMYTLWHSRRRSNVFWDARFSFLPKPNQILPKFYPIYPNFTQFTQILPNYPDFIQILPNLPKIYPNFTQICPNWPKFCTNLPKKKMLGDAAASPAPTLLPYNAVYIYTFTIELRFKRFCFEKEHFFYAKAELKKAMCFL